MQSWIGICSEPRMKSVGLRRNGSGSTIKQYNEERPHDALGDLTPIEYLVADTSAETLTNAWG